MNYREYCDFIREHYVPQDRKLYSWNDSFFVPDFIRALRDDDPPFPPSWQQVHPGVYTFDMFELDFCRRLLKEIAHFERWCIDNNLGMLRPNTMNNYGAVLDTFGFAPFLQLVTTECVQPLAGLLYPDVGGGSLDSHHGFVVQYECGKDVSLDFHVDASDVTLNVCLGEEFSGGELFFRGVRCALCQQTAWTPEEEFSYRHVPGRAVLHRGKHRHGAHPIASGNRSNLILWCNSSRFAQEYDASVCPSWCGQHGRSNEG